MAEVLFADIILKQRVEDWADGYEWDAVQKLEEHFEQLFPTKTIVIVEVVEEFAGHLSLKVECVAWEGKREFCLDDDGRLFYDRMYGPAE